MLTGPQGRQCLRLEVKAMDVSTLYCDCDNIASRPKSELSSVIVVLASKSNIASCVPAEIAPFNSLKALIHSHQIPIAAPFALGVVVNWRE